MSLSQEQPPISTDDELSEFLNRRFVDVGNELIKPSKFPQRKEMPYKPQIGDVHYFGDPGTHNYDASITAEGFWGLTSGGWLGLDSVSGGGAPITSVFGRTGAITALQADYDSFFLTLAEGNANYLGITGKAADSELLDGIDSTGFLLVGAKAADSELLDGIDSLNYARTDIAESFSNHVNIANAFSLRWGDSNERITGNNTGLLDFFTNNTRAIRINSSGDVIFDFNILPSNDVDGRDIAIDGTKLDTIETNAKDDQTAAEIEAIVDHDNLLGFLSTEHFLQSAISITLSQVSDSGALAALNTVGTTQIDNDAVTFAKMQNIPTANIIGRVTGGTGNPEDLTSTQATTLINNFTNTLKGLAPPSGGGSANFLRADGVWNAPAGSGGNVSNSGTPLNDQIPIWTDASTIEGDPDLTFNGSALTVGVASATTIVSRIAAVDGFKLIPGLSVGGWARGLVVRKFSDDARIAGTGFLGSAESLTSWHVGFGATWWSGADLAMTINASTKLATFEGNIALTGSGTVDGRDVSVDGATLDAIDAGRTWDNS